jgi:hypothetical protein
MCDLYLNAVAKDSPHSVHEYGCVCVCVCVCESCNIKAFEQCYGITRDARDDEQVSTIIPFAKVNK